MNPELRIPKRVSIETIYGCNASCIMCPIDIVSPRKKGVMPVSLTTKIFQELAPHAHLIDKLDLFGLGEPLLDPHLIARIREAKSLGFRNLAISTNAEKLDATKRADLLDSGIETIIFSIDGIRPETHEAIRRRLHYPVVLENCLAMIRERNEGNFPTRFVVRFIRQPLNEAEWDDYAAFWSEALSAARRDVIIRYDAHSWSGAVTAKDQHLAQRDPLIEIQPCWHVFEHLVVLCDGTVPLCSEDWHKGTVKYGNVATDSVLDIFNSKTIARIREIHASGQKTKIPLCQECTVHYSMPTKLELSPTP
jgi:sulfatase maturation enzyme AslB (radical SAM superfamily)